MKLKRERAEGFSFEDMAEVRGAKGLNPLENFESRKAFLASNNFLLKKWNDVNGQRNVLTLLVDGFREKNNFN